MLSLNQQTRVHELIRKKGAVAIRKSRFQLDRAGGRVDLVIERKQRARRKLRLLRPIECIDCKPVTTMQLLSNLRQIILSNTEEHVDRLQLRDDEHAVGISGMNDVAGIDEAQTNPSCDRRRDPAIRELNVRIIYLPLIELHNALELVDRGHLRVELLFRNRVLAVRNLITTEIDVRIFQEGFVALILTLCLFELSLKRTRVNLCKQVALFDHLTFAVVDAHQLTVDATLNRDRVHRRNRAERVDINADASLLGHGNRDRHTGRRWWR